MTQARTRFELIKSNLNNLWYSSIIRFFMHFYSLIYFSCMNLRSNVRKANDLRTRIKLFGGFEGEKKVMAIGNVLMVCAFARNI